MFLIKNLLLISLQCVVFSFAKVNLEHDCVAEGLIFQIQMYTITLDVSKLWEQVLLLGNDEKNWGYLDISIN